MKTKKISESFEWKIFDKMDLGKSSNISGSIVSILSPSLFDKGTKDYSLVKILLMDLSIFIDLFN